MTDPETTAEDPAPASAAARHLPAGPGTADPGRPATAAPRRRRWITVAALTVAVLAGLAAGVVVWAPWIPPTVLRPDGLRAGPATVNSVTLRWSRPRTGPLPDKYLIWSNGTLAGSATGTANSYRQAGLDPGSPYAYRVVAVRGGRKSSPSALLRLATRTPPISQARLQGSWAVHVSVIRSQNVTGPRTWSLSWTFSPVCRAGACDVILSGPSGRGYTITMKLIRTGATYQGQGIDSGDRCGPAGNSIPDPQTLKVRIRVKTAAAQGPEWAATDWSGTMTGTTQYVSSATYYCNPTSATDTVRPA